MYKKNKRLPAGESGLGVGGASGVEGAGDAGVMGVSTGVVTMELLLLLLLEEEEEEDEEEEEEEDLGGAPGPRAFFLGGTAKKEK